MNHRHEHTDALSEDGVLSFLDPVAVPVNVRVHSSVTSTNDVAKGLASAGALPGTVIVAESQTAGKGRMGRSFYSPPGCGIYMSLILRPARAESRLLLTTAVAVAAARAIERACDCRIQIKWVNDLYLGGKKIAGILTEAVLYGKAGAGPEPEGGEAGAAGCVIVGIGLNVRESEDGFPDDLAEKAGVLCAGGAAVSRNRLAAELIREIWRTVKGFDEQPEEWRRACLAEARSRSCVLGREVRVEGHERLTDARAVGLDEQGALIVEDDTGCRHALNSGEISLRLR